MYPSNHHLCQTISTPTGRDKKNRFQTHLDSHQRLWDYRVISAYRKNRNLHNAPIKTQFSSLKKGDKAVTSPQPLKEKVEEQTKRNVDDTSININLYTHTHTRQYHEQGTTFLHYLTGDLCLWSVIERYKYRKAAFKVFYHNITTKVFYRD